MTLIAIEPDAAAVYVKAMTDAPTPPDWRDAAGAPISCDEKLKVLNENWREIAQLCQEAMEDAVLMGCSEEVARDAFMAAAQSARNPYKR